MLRIAGVQFIGHADRAANVAKAERMVREAAARGARIACLPPPSSPARAEETGVGLRYGALKTGGRFSANAVSPSTASGERMCSPARRSSSSSPSPRRMSRP